MKVTFLFVLQKVALSLPFALCCQHGLLRSPGRHIFLHSGKSSKGRRSWTASQSCLKLALHVECTFLGVTREKVLQVTGYEGLPQTRCFRRSGWAEETWPLPFLTLFHYFPERLCFRIVCSLCKYTNQSVIKCSRRKLTRRAKRLDPILSAAWASHRDGCSPAAFGWVCCRHSSSWSDMI